jgi:hypothetical protein
MTSLPVDDYCPSSFESSEVLSAWGVALTIVTALVFLLEPSIA